MNLNVTLVIQLVVFVVLGWVTMRFIWPPLIAALEERQRKIAEGLISAEKAEKSLAEAKANATEILKDARLQATKIIDQANRRSNELVDEARGTAIAEGQRLLSDALAPDAVTKLLADTNHLLREQPMRIYGPPYALALVRERLSEMTPPRARLSSPRA